MESQPIRTRYLGHMTGYQPIMDLQNETKVLFFFILSLYLLSHHAILSKSNVAEYVAWHPRFELIWNGTWCLATHPPWPDEIVSLISPSLKELSYHVQDFNMNVTSYNDSTWVFLTLTIIYEPCGGGGWHVNLVNVLMFHGKFQNVN